jgi:ferredoxin
MDKLNARNDREENMGITSDPYRLSCQARANGDVTIEISE